MEVTTAVLNLTEASARSIMESLGVDQFGMVTLLLFFILPWTWWQMIQAAVALKDKTFFIALGLFAAFTTQMFAYGFLFLTPYVLHFFVAGILAMMLRKAMKLHRQRVVNRLVREQLARA